MFLPQFSRVPAARANEGILTLSTQSCGFAMSSRIGMLRRTLMPRVLAPSYHAHTARLDAGAHVRNDADARDGPSPRINIGAILPPETSGIDGRVASVPCRALSSIIVFSRVSNLCAVLRSLLKKAFSAAFPEIE